MTAPMAPWMAPCEGTSGTSALFGVFAVASALAGEAVEPPTALSIWACREFGSPAGAGAALLSLLSSALGAPGFASPGAPLPSSLRAIGPPVGTAALAVAAGASPEAIAMALAVSVG